MAIILPKLSCHLISRSLGFIITPVIFDAFLKIPDLRATWPVFLSLCHNEWVEIELPTHQITESQNPRKTGWLGLLKVIQSTQRSVH